LETSTLRASIKYIIGIVSLQLLILIPTFAQVDTLWYYHPDHNEPHGYSIIQSSNDTNNGKIEHHFINSDVVAEEYYLINGKKYGTYRSFYESGTLREFHIYSGDVLNGEYTAYNTSGKITVKGVYKKGVKRGYWAFLEERCFGHYKKDEKHRKWKCFDGAGKLESRVFYHYGTLLTYDKKENKEKKKSNAAKKKSKSDPKVEANKVNNPRFRDNIYLGQRVYILEVSGSSMEQKVEGKVAQILTKSSFNGLGIKVMLENGKKGRVVEFIDYPSTEH